MNIVKQVDTIIQQAIVCGASDIHIESIIQGLRIRYRIDGVLCDQQTIPIESSAQFLARIKILSHLNISERRVPQDGKFCFDMQNGQVDLRVSSFPSLYGEKIVIRILDRTRQAIKLDQLGFNQKNLLAFNELIGRSHGFLLVTGPTGSGKTTTLYASLAVLNDPSKNIITLEDPVEYNLDGITQGQIHSDAGFTFERGIRSLLRQDPDIAMIGEIRDKQTARIGIEAALTGHLVLSTLHTNEAPSAIMRLMDMGIEPFLLNASITGVLAQRLARKICQHCKEKVAISSHDTLIIERNKWPINTVYNGRGCSYCHNLGYKGRIGLFELLVVSNGLRSLIVQHPVIEDIYKQAHLDGMQTMIDDGIQKVNEGIISLPELLRVLC